MLLRIDDKNEECPLDLVKSLADLGGSSSTGQVRSEFPDVRGLRNNWEEGSGSSGEKDIIFKKFGCVCNERKTERAEYIKSRKTVF